MSSLLAYLYQRIGVLKDVGFYKTKIEEKNKTVRYLFESNGVKIIAKAIEYTHVFSSANRDVYNLGFGDYDEKTGSYIDDSNTNNGDMYQVFNTVLNSVEHFFSTHPLDFVIVTGSDSAEGFEEKCRKTCVKNCAGTCRNINRRIQTYAGYVSRKFEDLKKNYVFYGSTKNAPISFKEYVPGHDYYSILVKKKK